MIFSGENRNILSVKDVRLAIRDIWTALRGLFDVVPVGFISGGLWAPEGSDPPGWLYCNGRKNFSTTTYNRLFQHIGTRFGSDGDGMFGIPDLRDRFLNGAYPDLSDDSRPGTYELTAASGTTYPSMRVSWYIKTG